MSTKSEWIIESEDGTRCYTSQDVAEIVAAGYRGYSMGRLPNRVVRAFTRTAPDAEWTLVVPVDGAAREEEQACTCGTWDDPEGAHAPDCGIFAHEHSSPLGKPDQRLTRLLAALRAHWAPVSEGDSKRADMAFGYAQALDDIATAVENDFSVPDDEQAGVSDSIKAMNPDLDTAWRKIVWWEQTCDYWRTEALKGYARRDPSAPTEQNGEK